MKSIAADTIDWVAAHRWQVAIALVLFALAASARGGMS